MISFNWSFFLKPCRPEGTPFEDGKLLTFVFFVILINVAFTNIVLVLKNNRCVEFETNQVSEAVRAIKNMYLDLSSVSLCWLVVG